MLRTKKLVVEISKIEYALMVLLGDFKTLDAKEQEKVNKLALEVLIQSLERIKEI